MPETDVDLLIRAAQTSGPIAMGFANDALNVVDKKDGQGPVTAADYAVNEHLIDVLRGAQPDYGWLSEETPDDSDRLDRDRVFIVDPIDGTRAFIEGSQHWAHSLAIAERGEIIAAAIYLPACDRMFSAEKGTGAFFNGQPIRAKASTDVDKAEVLTNKAAMGPENWKRPPGFKRCFRSSLAYRMALVAQGRFDAMLTLRPTWEWDIAAGALIVNEAGGEATDSRGVPLRFNSAHPQCNGVVAANPRLAAAIRVRLA